MMLNSHHFSIKHAGFTLVELVAVMMIIGVLSVSVFSRFSDTSGFAEYTYQARLISSLRNMQTRAMHDTRQEYCFQINVDTSPAAFGPPTLSYTTGTSADTCDTSIDFTNPQYLSTNATEMTAEQVSLSTLPSFDFIAFNGLGQPVNAAGVLTCSAQCEIVLTGESSVSVCIESQGYIHAC